MLRVVHTPITEIQPTQKPNILVNYDDLLVVAPEERNQNEVWVSQYSDVWVQGLQVRFCVLRVVIKGKFGLQEYYYVDLYISLSSLFENPVQSVLTIHVFRPDQHKIRRYHPISYENLLLS